MYQNPNSSDSSTGSSEKFRLSDHGLDTLASLVDREWSGSRRTLFFPAGRLHIYLVNSSLWMLWQAITNVFQRESFWMLQMEKC